MNARAAIFIAALAAAPLAVLGADALDWPPPEAVQNRMTELQSVIHDPASSLEQREKARDELRGLLKIPLPAHAPRAAIQPFPSVVKPTENPVVKLPAPPVAHVEVVQPPKPLIIPQSGAPVIPAPGMAIDPRTGQVLHETAGGYINPRTGEFIPR